MKTLTLICTALILVSCSTTSEWGKNSKKKEQKTSAEGELPQELRPDVEKSKEFYVHGKDFWPATHYHRTTVTVEQPKFLQTETQLWEICKGPQLQHLLTYGGARVGRVAYMKIPVTFYTDSGFKRDIYVTKGMCRELALYASHGKETVKLDAARSFRHHLTRMVFDMVYTEKSFASKLVFTGRHTGVKFEVR